MKIGIITAMTEETRSIVRALEDTRKTRLAGFVVHQSQLAGHELMIVEAGMGFANAVDASRHLISEFRPALIVSAGYCGGITKELQVGDAVFATGLVIVSGNGVQQVAVTIPELCHAFISRQNDEGRRLFAGLFVTTRVIMQKSRLAAMLPADAQCPVVEMESAAIALNAAENGIPFVGLRTVSDPFDEELGFSLDEVCDDRMRIRIPKVLLTVARKPRIIPQLIRLARNSRVAAASLTRATREFLKSL